MSNDILKVPKIRKQVTLWVHPEGRVVGSLFLRTQGVERAGEQEPLEVLNQDQNFLVVQLRDPYELRFYNRRSIIRVEYEEAPGRALAEVKPLPCELHMMDGSLISGLIKEPLPPDRSRLFDYLNRTDERFLKVHVEGGMVYLVNKTYILHATTSEDRDAVS